MTAPIQLFALLDIHLRFDLADVMPPSAMSVTWSALVPTNPRAMCSSLHAWLLAWKGIIVAPAAGLACAAVANLAAAALPARRRSSYTERFILLSFFTLRL